VGNMSTGGDFSGFRRQERRWLPREDSQIHFLPPTGTKEKQQIAGAIWVSRKLPSLLMLEAAALPARVKVPASGRI
jgi:hypothetical protein